MLTSEGTAVPAALLQCEGVAMACGGLNDEGQGDLPALVADMD